MKVYKMGLAVVFCGLHGMLFAQNSSKVSFGKGMTVMAADSTVSMKFQFRMQHLFEAEQGLGSGGELESSVMVRRSRLKFAGHVYDPRLTYKVELGLSSRDIAIDKEDGNTDGASRIIYDAVLKYQLTSKWSVWVGQTKLPGNRERVVSSGSLQLVDRSILNSRFNLDRDMGLQLHGKYRLGGNFIVQPKLALTMGEGRNISESNIGGYDYLGRIELLPFGEFEGKADDYVGSDLLRQSKPKLAVGATYNYNDHTPRQQGQLGSFIYRLDDEGNATSDYALYNLRSVQLDAILKFQGLSWMTEFAVTSTSPILLGGILWNEGSEESAPDQELTNLSRKYHTGTGFNTQLGYLFKNNFEVAGRYSAIAPDDSLTSGIKETTEYTLGFSKYFSGHNLKAQTDLTFQELVNTDGAIRFRLQVEMQF